MKKIIIALAIFGLAVCFTGHLAAQPPPPNQNNDGSSANGPALNGSGAPIGDGAGLLAVFAVAYAISIYKKKEKEKIEE